MQGIVIDVRLTGTKEDTAALMAELQKIFNVTGASAFYLNRRSSTEGRLYFKITAVKTQDGISFGIASNNGNAV